MTGLILKDLINLKSQGKILGLFVIVYMVMGIMMDDASFFVGFITVILMILPITALSYDERAKWDRYALTMPVNRFTMVLEKYVLAVALFGVAVIIDATMLQFIHDESSDIFAYIMIMSIAAIVMVSVVLPIIYKMGVEKARYFMIGIVCIPIILTSVAVQVFDSWENMPGFLVKLSETETISLVTGLVAIATSMAIMAASFALSLKIYLKKEF